LFHYVENFYIVNSIFEIIQAPGAFFIYHPDIHFIRTACFFFAGIKTVEGMKTQLLQFYGDHGKIVGDDGVTGPGKQPLKSEIAEWLRLP
jgi:hypothetical protein